METASPGASVPSPKMPASMMTGSPVTLVAKSRDYGVVASKALDWNLPLKRPDPLRSSCPIYHIANIIALFESNRQPSKRQSDFGEPASTVRIHSCSSHHVGASSEF
jgi:hypothetical protein